MTNLDNALALIGEGLPIFPCNPTSKAPLVAGGFTVATINRAKVETWWRENPDALIGVPTGVLSDIDAIDIDPRHGGADWLRANSGRVKRTRTHTTRSGGIHILYRHADGLRLSAGAVAPGVDVRADGGYIIWWPAHGLRVSGEDTMEWPSDLLSEVFAARSRARAPDDGRDAAEIAPPSAEAVVDLLNRLPNPLETDRDAYMTVMLAARGCIQGLEAAGLADGADEIAEAAVAWAERWEGYDGTDEREKWDADWSTRDAPLAGWPTLERIAGRLLPGYREECAAAEFDALPIEDTADALLDELDAQSWAALELPPTQRYLGAVLQTASRLNLIGATGLGKTQISHAIAAGIASGHGFGPWGCDAPARVLIIDGEMSTRLLKSRMASAIARHGHPIPRHNLVVYGLDRSDHFKASYPWLGDFHPLNVPEGSAFLRRLIGHVRPEVVIFDNVMSLMSGDQKDEVTWSGALAVMSWLTRERIAQVWLDHTTHTANRQYGSVTKMWRADAVGVMSPVDKKELSPGQIKFTLTFSAPQGKARERDETNYRDFADRLFTMDASGWAHTEVRGDKLAAALDPVGALGGMSRLWYDALLAIAKGGKADRGDWFAEGVRRGLADPIHNGLSRAEKESRNGKLRNALSDMQKHGLVRVENVTDVILAQGEDEPLGALV